ncbi:unnamed protein product [Ceratitis capitata]|uniref:(Mediterranean fruit fly) hypothetical protein n=1 Tax=Ceratitis capitata TaxID=7213 RepID=A0A811UC00_CERCA|nr:unnamed protein product [Ceratitis capitata]
MEHFIVIGGLRNKGQQQQKCASKTENSLKFANNRPDGLESGVAREVIKFRFYNRDRFIKNRDNNCQSRQAVEK